MKASIVPFPLGGWQGTPALRCVINNPAELGLDLIEKMRALSESGVRLAWVETDLWGDEAWEDFLIKLMNDRVFGEMTVATIRSSIQPKWSNIGIDWVIDISQSFSKPMNVETLHLTAVSASQVPVPAELVWFNPPPQNLTVGALEIIHDAFGPTVGGWIYTEDEKLSGQAFRNVSRAAALWGVRARGEGSWLAT